jgi:[acyl-carrier-protein] S-malonyltransferase
MREVVLLFPGQGSQYIGMGKNLNPLWFNQADDILGMSLSKLCFEGSEDELKLTKNTQPALLTHSYSLFKNLEAIFIENKIKIKAVLGHSVGEYAALCAASVLTFEDALKAVRKRGELMQEAVPVGVGKMIAILRINSEWVQKACEAVSTKESIVEPANFNDPSQTVISGHAEACDKAVEWLKNNCPERMGAIPLSVSAPFHCSLMKPAAQEMKLFLETLSFKKNQIPYVANINASFYETHSSACEIKNNLIEQISGSVRWAQSMKHFSAQDLFIEVGPSKVLTQMMKKIIPEAKVFSMDQEDSAIKLKEFLT